MSLQKETKKGNTLLNKLKILISKGYVNKKGKGSNTVYTIS